MDTHYGDVRTRDGMFVIPRDEETPRVKRREISTDSSCLTKIIDKIMSFFKWIINLIKNCCCPKNKKNREIEFRQREFEQEEQFQRTPAFRIGRDDTPYSTDRMSAVELDQYSSKKGSHHSEEPSSHTTHKLSRRQFEIYSKMASQQSVDAYTAASDEEPDTHSERIHTMTSAQLKAYGLLPFYRAQPFAIEDQSRTRAEQSEMADVVVEDYQAPESMLNQFMDAFGLSPEKIIGEEEIRAAQEFMETRTDEDAANFQYRLSDAQYVALTKAPAIAFRLLTHLEQTDYSYTGLYYCQETQKIDMRTDLDITDQNLVRNSFPEFYDLTQSEEGRKEIQDMKDALVHRYPSAFSQIPKASIERDVKTLCSQFF